LTLARAAAALALLLHFAAGIAAPAGAEPPRFSLLALGDTGAPPDDSEGYETQLAVAAAMAASDRARPVRALVLLGDNFYPDGLARAESVARIRANLVRPYCRFLALAGPRASEVSDACAAPAARRDPLPVFALLVVLLRDICCLTRAQNEIMLSLEYPLLNVYTSKIIR